MSGFDEWGVMRPHEGGTVEVRVLGGAVMVDVHSDATAWLTPDEARAMAARLLTVADRCDTPSETGQGA